jgi:hypothetical protein
MLTYADEAYDARLPAEGATLYQRNKNREAQQDALIEARASWESRQEIPGVRDRIKWRERNEEKMANDVFSSASQAASRRNSSMRASAPVTGTSYGDEAPSPSPGPGEIFGPNFYAQRTPVYRQSLGDAAERRRSGRDLQAMRKNGHAEGSAYTSAPANHLQEALRSSPSPAFVAPHLALMNHSPDKRDTFPFVK